MRVVAIVVLWVGGWMCLLAQERPTTDTAIVDPDGTTRVTRVVPVPDTISTEARKYVSRPYSDHEPPVTVAQNRANASAYQEQLIAEMQDMYPTKVTNDRIAGVPVRIITPAVLAPEKQDRVLINLHGGGFQADWGSVCETIPIAGLTHTKVVAILYSLSPDSKFPVAVDEAVAVYRELLKTHKPQQMVIYGTSAGAFLTAEVAMKLKQLGLPEPAALGVFSGAGDVGDLGDSFYIFGLHGLSGSMDTSGNTSRDYAGNANSSDSVLNPIRGDLKGMPPTLFLTSTRDLLLSGTVLLHRAFLHASVAAELVVFDGLPHAFWNEYRMPESREADQMMADFFEEHLGGSKAEVRSAK